MRSEIAISVLITDYNTPQQNLVCAVRSILAQDFQEFELVVVDDGSDRATISVLQEFEDSRIKVIRHEINQGTAAALNTGVEAASGEYIVRLDSDDWVESSYINVVHQAILSEPQFSVISCRGQEFSDDGSTGPSVGTVGEKTVNDILRRSTPLHGASIMRRADILAVGGYPPYRRGQDFALWCELILNGRRLKVIEPVLYHYRVNSSDYAKRTLRSRKDTIAAMLYYYPRLGASPLDYRFILQSILAGILPSKLLKFVSEQRRYRKQTRDLTLQ